VDKVTWILSTDHHYGRQKALQEINNAAKLQQNKTKHMMKLC